MFPEVSTIFQVLPFEVEFSVIKFPDVPVAVRLVTVVVVDAVKSTVCGGVSTLKSANVLDPEIIKLPVPAPVNHILLYVLPPPANVLVLLLASFILIVEVLWFTIKFVTVVAFHTVPTPVNVHVPVPIDKTLVREPVIETVPTVIFLSFALNVPLVITKPTVLTETDKSSCRV